jgi:signal transduction histidine kinase
VGFLDAILGRSTPPPADLDALFRVPSAAITLQAALGLVPTGDGSVCFRAAAGPAFADAQREVLDLLAATPDAPQVHVSTDGFGFTWVEVDRPPHDPAGGDLGALCTDLHAVNTTLEAAGFGTALLCTVVPFADSSGRRAGLVYLYKQGTFYAFAPAAGTAPADRRRDDLLELGVTGTGLRVAIVRAVTATQDDQRVRSIRQYDVLARPPRLELQAIVELAAKICDTPMATINLITDTEQHQVAAYGFDAAICSREDSMCAAVLEDDTPLVVPDARLDPRFQDNPFVTGVIGSVRFYASHQLTTLDGVVIGTLCVFDEQPRDLDAAQVEALGTLAERVVDVLELSLRSRQLAQSNERLSTFAGRISHDLKSPLTSVSMSLEMLRERLAEEDDAADAVWLLERAINGSRRMAALIDEVLQYASLGGSMSAEPVDLDQSVSDVLSDLSGSLAGVEVVRRGLPTVVGDAVQLRSVLQNLLDNASKYRHPRRPLAITVSAEQVGDGRVAVSVADNGLGIPEADRERVFEPRVRLSDDGRGSGIGLDTVRRVVQAHGGTIGIAETPGGGTTVTFELNG